MELKHKAENGGYFSNRREKEMERYVISLKGDPEKYQPEEEVLIEKAAVKQENPEIEIHPYLQPL